MEINIPDNNEKGKLHALFLPGLVLLVGIGAFGLVKLHTIEQARQPVTIEYEATASTTPPRGLGTPPKLGGEASTSILQTKSTTTPAAKTGIYVASRGGTVYYLPSCTASKRISEKNKIWFDTKAEAEKFGYKPAKNCPGI